jgi:HSP90 family molecular chaperone
MAPLLRFESSTSPAGTAVSLDAYVERRKEAQKSIENTGELSIYYLCAPSRELALSSTYMEAFKRSGTEVLFMYGQADDFVMKHLQSYKELRIVNAEAEDVELPITPVDAVDEADSSRQADTAEALSTEEAGRLCEWIMEVLSERKVRTPQTRVARPGKLRGEFCGEPAAHRSHRRRR